MTRCFALTAATALGLSLAASAALADSKSQMCANRMDSCLSKCDATKQACRDVCTGIWEDCISHGGWSTQAPSATMGSTDTAPTRPLRGVSGGLKGNLLFDSNR